MIVAALARLLSLVAMVLVGLWFGRLLRGMGRRAQPGAGRAPSGRSQPPQPGEPMVRDRVCNTFLPRARAIEIRREGQSHFFCSDACRSRFESGSVSEKSA